MVGNFFGYEQIIEKIRFAQIAKIVYNIKKYLEGTSRETKTNSA
jgi:hypothetical protein